MDSFLAWLPWIIVFLLLIVGLIAYGGWKEKKEAERRAALMGKYNDAEIVMRIMGQKVWIGQTAEQLLESWGRPAAVDKKQLKTKRKEVWKWGQTGRNRYTNRVTLDNDVVVTYDIKG